MKNSFRNTPKQTGSLPSKSEALAVDEWVKSLYKTDASRLTAVLLRLLGAAHIELVEDVIQDCFEKALSSWQMNAIPENPSAWLMTTAKNRAYDVLRNNKVRAKYADTLSPTITSSWTLTNKINEEFDSLLAINDEQLRLLVWLSSSDLDQSYLLPVMLKMVCGLSTDAIARALLITESNAKKRITRAIQQLKSHVFDSNLSAVTQSTQAHLHAALYLMFNEGLNKSHHLGNDNNILSIEALNLATFVLTNNKLASNFTLPLVALMHFYLARQPARFDEEGCPIALHLQNRKLWKNRHLMLASLHLSSAIDNANLGTNGYLYEALIAHEHMRAARFEETNWTIIIDHYRQWLSLTTSPMVAINLAIAKAHGGHIEDAILMLELHLGHKQLQNSYQVHASLAYVHGLNANQTKAQEHLNAAELSGMQDKELTALKNQLALL